MSAGKLPEGWKKIEIGDVAVVISGGTPKSGIAENFAPPGEGIAWLTPADLSGYRGKYISHGARDLTTLGYSSCSAKLMPKGTILFSSRAPIGYVAIAANEIATNQGFKSFAFTSDIFPDYAYYFLRNIRHVAEEMGTGTTFKEISGSSAKTLPFVLAPLAEQKIIAEKLDTLLAQVDSTKARLEQIPKILKRFRQAVLAAAVNGKLTGVTIIPLGNLGDITDIISGVAFKKAQYATSGYRLLQIANVTYGRTCWDSVSYIPLVLAKQYSNYSLKVGDIALALNRPITNNRLKVTGICNNDLPSTLYQRVARFRVKENNSFISSDYLLLIMQSFSFLKKIEGNLKGSDQPYINTSTLDKFQIFAPSLPEQQEIVRRVEQLFAYADTIEKQVNNALARVNNLTQSILAKAFRGELTAQWRAENPDLISGENSAAALLEKIKAERAASGSKKASRKKT
ncbi:TPA: restriction endonuclease subunit S [Yersinia enterocolitica]